MSSRKKILFVNNNMKLGGVQKALLEVLKQLHGQYDVTLLLFRKTGPLLEQIPGDVRVLETSSHYRYLGMSQGECRTPGDKLRRGLYAVISKKMGICRTIPLMDKTVNRENQEVYDCAISFLHCGNVRTCYGGVAEYTLRHVQARMHACYIHCDYLHSGTCTEYSKDIYRQFDRMICVSKSVRRAFLEALPELTEKTVVLENPVDPVQICSLSREEPVSYDEACLNMLTVARLAAEKGIERIIRAMAEIRSEKLRYYVVGSGPLREQLTRQIQETGLEKQVFLVGERSNPYAYMAGADVLAVPSYHEAAPVVFQEAAVLGLPVLTTRTLSAEEMISADRGIVVDNTEQALVQAIADLARAPQNVKNMRKNCKSQGNLPNEFLKKFQKLVCETNQ